jgi:hypothetical protein
MGATSSFQPEPSNNTPIQLSFSSNNLSTSLGTIEINDAKETDFFIAPKPTKERMLIINSSKYNVPVDIGWLSLKYIKPKERILFENKYDKEWCIIMVS